MNLQHKAFSLVDEVRSFMSGTQSLCFLEGVQGFELEDLKSYNQALSLSLSCEFLSNQIKLMFRSLIYDMAVKKTNKRKSRCTKGSSMCNSSLLSSM